MGRLVVIIFHCIALNRGLPSLIYLHSQTRDSSSSDHLSNSSTVYGGQRVYQHGLEQQQKPKHLLHLTTYLLHNVYQQAAVYKKKQYFWLKVYVFCKKKKSSYSYTLQLICQTCKFLQGVFKATKKIKMKLFLTW